LENDSIDKEQDEVQYIVLGEQRRWKTRV